MWMAAGNATAAATLSHEALAPVCKPAPISARAAGGRAGGIFAR
jgi:hypothetical protein